MASKKASAVGQNREANGRFAAGNTVGRVHGVESKMPAVVVDIVPGISADDLAVHVVALGDAASEVAYELERAVKELGASKSLRDLSTKYNVWAARGWRTAGEIAGGGVKPALLGTLDDDHYQRLCANTARSLSLLASQAKSGYQWLQENGVTFTHRGKVKVQPLVRSFGERLNATRRVSLMLASYHAWAGGNIDQLEKARGEALEALSGQSGEDVGR